MEMSKAKSNNGNNTNEPNGSVFIHIDNPYRPFDSGEWFYNEKAVNQIKDTFNDEIQNKIIVLQGKPGAGKTSTLMRIADSKGEGVLGHFYVPVYLDSRTYIKDGQTFNELLTTIYRDVVGKLTRYGVGIEKPRYKNDGAVTDDMIKSFLLNVEVSLKPDEILLLIFDELDYFLESVDPTILNTLVDFFKKLEHEWNRFGLILAGDKRLINLTSVKSFNRFLASATQVDIEDFLEENVIKELITEPVEKQMRYDEEAVDRICYYSGKNLFFQQLICHEIVDLLNRDMRNLCSAEDVERAVKLILDSDDKERPRFIYAWKHKLTLNGRLLASALADEKVTSSQEKEFHLGPSLLDDILGEQIFDEIQTLQGFDYLEKNQERQFKCFPFRMPLYGLWIRKEHPFLKTVLHNIHEIAGKINLKRLLEDIEPVPAHYLAPLDKDSIRDIAWEWIRLTDEIHDKRAIIGRIKPRAFVEQFARFLNLKIKERNGSHKDHENIGIDIRSLNIGVLNEAFCYFQDRPELTESYRANIENYAVAMAQDTQYKLILFFCPRKSDLIKGLVKKSYLNLIAIDEDDLKRIFFSERPSDYFRKLILHELSVHKVSPYQTAGPAKSTFYGRSDIINRILRSTENSYAIVGSRKIGKSSLLLKIKENPPVNTVFIFMDLEYEFANVDNYSTFLKSLKSDIFQALGKNVKFGLLPFMRNINKLPGVIRKLAKEEKRIVFILDEMDKLIAFDKDRDYALMRIFRNLSQKGLCQFIFAGFKELYHTKRDIDNPLYNFYEEIRLLPLGKEPALDLITKPMESIGVEYQHDIDRELILEYTTGHPNLIQFFCKHLIEKVEKHRETHNRTILREDIEEVCNKEYEAYVMDEVYMFHSDLSDINRLILVLMVDGYPPAKGYFTSEDIRSRLKEHGIPIKRKEANEHIKNLVMRFIFLDKGRDQYIFALPQFPEILKRYVDDDLKKNLIEDIKDKTENGDTL